MKKFIKNIILRIYKFLKKANKEFNDLDLKDKKNIIMDQLFFNISTLETIELLQQVNQECKTRLVIQKQESLEVVEAISQLYIEEVTE